MSRTVCLRSWFRCCGAVALTAFFALNSTSIWAAEQVIAAGETVSGAVGTEENTLTVNGTLTDSEISGGQNHKVNSGGTIDKSVISGGKLEISSGGVLENTTQTGGYINFNEGSSSENFIYEGGSFLAINADIKNLTIKHLLSFYDDGVIGSDFDMSNVFSLTADEFVEVIKKQSNGDTLTEKEQTVLEDIGIYLASNVMLGLYGVFGNIDGLKTEVSEKTPLINYAKYLRNIVLIEFGLSDDAYLKNFYNKAKEGYEALGDRLFMSFMEIRNAEITNIPLVLGGAIGEMTGQVGYGENITLHDGGYLMSAISAASPRRGPSLYTCV